MLVRIGDAPIMLFLKIVIRQIRIAAAPQPELLDKLFAFFVRRQLQKRRSLVWRNDVHHVFAQPHLVRGIEFFQRLLDLLFLIFIQVLVRDWRGRVLHLRRLCWQRRSKQSDGKYGCKQGAYYL